MNRPKLDMARRAAKQHSDAENEVFELQKARTDLIAEMKAAEKVGDRNLVQQLAHALCDIEDQLARRPLANRGG